VYKVSNINEEFKVFTYIYSNCVTVSLHHNIKFLNNNITHVLNAFHYLISIAFLYVRVISSKISLFYYIILLCWYKVFNEIWLHDDAVVRT